MHGFCMRHQVTSELMSIQASETLQNELPTADKLRGHSVSDKVRPCASPLSVRSFGMRHQVTESSALSSPVRALNTWLTTRVPPGRVSDLVGCVSVYICLICDVQRGYRKVESLTLWDVCPFVKQFVAYNEANRKVAILCNHQRTVTKGMLDTLDTLTDRVGHHHHHQRHHHHGDYQRPVEAITRFLYASLSHSTPDHRGERSCGSFRRTVTKGMLDTLSTLTDRVKAEAFLVLSDPNADVKAMCSRVPVGSGVSRS
jgi:hypothetical protein